MLYLIATPIGNLGDITYRAVETLQKVSLILCEDTRTSRSLLTHFGIKTPTKAYHDHSDESWRLKIIDLLKEGQDIALISDAGSPLVCDPGYKLIRACQEHDIEYTSVPGASSVITALQLSGQPSQSFYFGGFLHSKAQARRSQLELALHQDTTVVFFETARRVLETCQILTEIMPKASVSIVREITKLYEEVLYGLPQELCQRIEEKPLKGEIVLVIHPFIEKRDDKDALDKKIRNLLPFMPVKALSSYLERDFDFSKKEIYERALILKEEV